MKILQLPHPQWGNRMGTATVVAELVTLSKDPLLRSLSQGKAALLDEMFSEGAKFLLQGSSEGEA